MKLFGAFAVVSAALAWAEAATATTARVGLAGPDGAKIVERLRRDLEARQIATASATVTMCSRDVVERLARDLDVDALLCTDGDQLGVWMRDGEHLTLKDAIVVQNADARAEEVAAARAMMTFGPSAEKPAPSPAPEAPRAPKPFRKMTPRWIFALGPSLVASQDGTSFGLSGEVQIGLGRYVALVPWLAIVPANRSVDGVFGRAEFRPTTLGVGFAAPLTEPTSVVVPRIGGGYTMVWLHVSPRAAFADATQRSSEDLISPGFYGNFAISIRATSEFRIVADGLFGATSHEMVVRIGFEQRAHWGMPFAIGALRGEWVIP